MDKIEVASLGGKANGLIQRERALNKYYKNPNKCKNCGEIIRVKENESAALVRKKKFCKASCSAIFNNTGRKRLDAGIRFCKKCGSPIRYRLKSGKYTRRKYCEKCYVELMFEINSVSEKTKGELFGLRKNWQSARSAIRRHAAGVFIQSGKPYKCEKCGYSLHIEVCHKKSVSSFPETSKVKEINKIENLVGFCETHHWEFDNGYLFFDNDGILRDSSEGRIQGS